MSTLDLKFAILDLRFWICDFGLSVKHLVKHLYVGLPAFHSQRRLKELIAVAHYFLASKSIEQVQQKLRIPRAFGVFGGYKTSEGRTVATSTCIA
ncbi:MAG: hypothetical protein SNJ50_06370 [Cyanobacteriota bacterium]